MDLRESLGRALGWLLAPITGAGSLLRRARFLHPEGVVYRARVTALAREAPLTEVAARLQGDALVRVSSALWRGRKEWIDALGFVVRFRSTPRVTPHPETRDQDLLFATIRRPWTTLLAPLTTDTHSFLRNDYYAVSPFEVTGLGRVRWRLVRPDPDTLAALAADGERGRGDGGRRGQQADGGDGRPRNAGAGEEGGGRWGELERVAAGGGAVFRLEARRTRVGSAWEPVAAVQLVEKVDIDQDALRFSPFLTGRGIYPRGLVHALRIGTYKASQAARPARRAEAGSPAIGDVSDRL